MNERLHLKILLLFMISTWITMPVKAQSNAGGLEFSFVRKSKKQTVDKVASNVFKIVNNSGLNKKLILKYNIPANWKMVGEQEIGILISKGDSAFIPVRVIPDKSAEGNTSYNIGVVVADNGLTVGGASYTVRINRISNWTADVPQKKVYFTADSDTTTFRVNLNNKGNSTENLLVTLKPDMDLSFSDLDGSSGQPLSREVSLAPGQDSVLVFVLRKKDEDMMLRAESPRPERNTTQSSGVRIHVKETGAKSKKLTRTWNGGIHAYTVPSDYDVGESLHGHIPITIDWNTYNILKSNTYSHLSIYGDALLKNEQSIAYYYQANFASNYLLAESYLGDYHYLGYNSKYFGAEVGNIGAPRNSYMFNGQGVRAHANYKGHMIEGIYVKNPELFGNSRVTGYGGGYSYIHQDGLFKVNTFVQERKDEIRKVDSRLAKVESHVRINKNHFVRLELGGSEELHYWDPTDEVKLQGYSYKVDYRGGVKRFRYNLRAYVGSETYLSYRGIENYSGQVRYGFNKGYAVAASYNHLNYEPELYSQGELIQQSVYTQRDIYRLRFSKSNKSSSVVISPQHQEIRSAIIHSQKSGVGVDYRYRRDKFFTISTKMFAGYNDLPNYDVDEFFTARFMGNVRYRYFSANIRYYYGPYLSREKVAFAETGENPQKLFANVYYDWWFGKDKFLLKTNLNYNYSTMYERSFLTTRPELFYYTESKFRFSIYGRFVMMDETRAAFNQGFNNQNFVPENIHQINYEFGFGIRKDIFIPAGFGKNSDLEVIAFKDVNGNGKQDPDEPGLGNMLLTVREVKEDSVLQEDDFAIKKYETITNDDGRAVFSNMPRGEYVLKAIPLESMGGWYDGKTMYVTLNGNRKLHLPLSKGGRISGQLSVEKANFSRFDNKVNVSNIRVTAFRENGKSFSTLTDGQGRFNLYVPSGSYVVTLNEAALGNSFRVVQNNQTIELTGSVDNINVNFYVVEKQRKIKVKKFDKVGGIKPSEDKKEPEPAENDTTLENVAPQDTSELLQQEPVELQEDTPATGAALQQDTSATVGELQDGEGSSSSEAGAGNTGEAEGYIPVEEFNEEGKIYAVQLIPVQKERKKPEDFKEAMKIAGDDQIFCLPNPEGNYIFVAGKYEKQRKASRLQKKLKDAYPQAKMIEVVEGNLIKEI